MPWDRAEGIQRVNLPRYFQIMVAAALFGSGIARGQVVNSEWNSFNGAWNAAGNWLPNDVPDNGGGLTYNVQIGNRPIAVNGAVTFIPEDGTSDTVTSLTITGGADLFTNGNQLLVTGQTTLSGSASTVRVDPHSLGAAVFAIDTDDLDIENAAVLLLNGGTANVDVLLEVNPGGAISGFGAVIVGDNDAAVETVLENSGTIQVANGNLPILRLATDGVDVIDLDGTTDAGVVDAANVLSDAMLDTAAFLMDAPLADAFSGVLQIGQRDTATFNFNFTMDGAEVQMDGGAFSATLNGPAAITSIANSAFTISNAAVIANNLTFTGSANTVTLNAGATLTLAGTIGFNDASALVFAGGAHLIVTGNTFITEAGGDFNWDGNGTAITTVSGSGSLVVNVDQIDVGDDIFNGTINLIDGGDLNVSTTANSWTMAGTLNKDAALTSGILGDLMNVSGAVNVNGGTLSIAPDATLANASTFNVAAGATANLNTTTIGAGSNIDIDGTMRLGFESVLAGPATLGGTGLFRLQSGSTVTANTTVNTTSFDWDGTGAGHTHTINDGVVFTINSTVWDPDDAGDMDDNITLGGNGAQLVVNGVSSWTMARTLTRPAGAGSATIGGSATMVLSSASGMFNVNGDTNVSAPITFGTGSTTTVDASRALNVTGFATYDGATITGAGSFNPSTVLNSVTSDTTISTANFDFDRAQWVVSNDATLTVNVSDYDNNATNQFNHTISIQRGTLSVQTADAEFVMDGILNLVRVLGGVGPTWSGEQLDIGNNATTLDADLNVSGSGLSRITADVDFNADADVNINSGATLELTGAALFVTQEGALNAEFTGGGTFSFSGPVTVAEPVTFNMPGGTVDLDGTDTTGDVVDIDAPLVINAATMSSFGRVNAGGGTNTLDINNAAGTGALSVTLDNPADEWTLNAPGVLSLTNDAAEATLLSGSAVNISGTVNVTGDVRIDARLDLGATSTVNINTAGEPLRLSGGTLANPNMIVGSTITGPGQLAADTDTALHGAGTIETSINFSGNSALKADAGILNINGSILDVGTIGTAAADGILNVTNPWTSNVADDVNLQGGELRGGDLTISNANGLTGTGLVAARVINNTRIAQTGAGGTLIVETDGNDNDWDGSTNTGTLAALSPGGTLELRDDSGGAFGGTVTAINATVFANGFGFNFSSSSTLNLTAGEFVELGGRLDGAVNIGTGQSTIETAPAFLLTFGATSVTTLTGDLWLRATNAEIDAGATFSGSGILGVPEGNSSLTLRNGADVNALIVNHGRFRIAGFAAAGRSDAKDYQQSATGEIAFDFAGTSLAQYDRFVVGGSVQLAGTLRTEFLSGFVPSLGQTFNIISASAGVLGTFDSAPKPAAFPDNRRFKISYGATLVQLTVVEDNYEPWINSFPGTGGARERGDDPDRDGLNNAAEFALDGNPASGATSSKIAVEIAPVGGENALTLTIPVRNGAAPAAADPPGGPLALEQTTDDLIYSVQASDELANWTLDVTEVTGSDATAIQAGLPPLSAGWVYRTFRSPGPVAGDPAEFMRVVVTDTE